MHIRDTKMGLYYIYYFFLIIEVDEERWEDRGVVLTPTQVNWS